MNFLNSVEKDILKTFKENDIPLDEVNLIPSSKKELGDYQINDAMRLAKIMHKSPREIAELLVKCLEETTYFENINIAGPGFINLSFKKELLTSYVEKVISDSTKDVENLEEEKIIIDYGGANIAKTLHVGHLRSANLGEAIKRLARRLGKDVIADVHFGDIGRQSGMIIYELKERYPSLNYFSGKTEEKWDDLPITGEDLEEIYPTASTKAKADDKIMEEVREITAELDKGENKGYVALWDKIRELSIKDIKAIYKQINTDFDLWNGESDAYPYIKETIDIMEKSGYLVESEGAKIVDVVEENDKSPMPPLVVIKSNGATLYATRELATILSRVKQFNPKEIWYLADMRQSLYFTQVFRAAYKTKLVPSNLKLSLYGFGTVNGTDGKPFKTRDGNAATLKGLIKDVKEEILTHMNKKLDNKDLIANQIAIAAIKYADFLPNRTTDYIFEPSKFIDVEGKTGPYILYNTIRMKSILEKATAKNLKYAKYTNVPTNTEKEIILLLMEKNNILHKAYNNKDLSPIADYLYNLTSLFSRFYEENHILTEQDQKKQESWLTLTYLVKITNEELLSILAIDIPEKM
ncbi:MAG TPA: arginine--tRNA ligase [Candidatus Onthousia faecavium]|nr:arginine--tRNA ligase [Candidatus Onthousia faecavium]